MHAILLEPDAVRDAKNELVGRSNRHELVSLETDGVAERQAVVADVVLPDLRSVAARRGS